MYSSLVKFCLRYFSNPTKIDNDAIVYCFAHNSSSIETIILTLKKYNINKIFLINNKKSVSGVETFDYNMRIYNDNNIKVTPIDYNESIIQTKIESNAVIDYLIKHNINKIILIAPIFHILRASLTFISSAMEYNFFINITSLLDNNCIWNNKYITHQGQNELTVDLLLDKEIERIKIYTQKGDIKDIKLILNYLYPTSK